MTPGGAAWGLAACVATRAGVITSGESFQSSPRPKPGDAGGEGDEAMRR